VIDDCVTVEAWRRRSFGEHFQAENFQTENATFAGQLQASSAMNE